MQDAQMCSSLPPVSPLLQDLDLELGLVHILLVLVVVARLLLVLPMVAKLPLCEGSLLLFEPRLDDVRPAKRDQKPSINKENIAFCAPLLAGRVCLFHLSMSLSLRALRHASLTPCASCFVSAVFLLRFGRYGAK